MFEVEPPTPVANGAKFTQPRQEAGKKRSGLVDQRPRVSRRPPGVRPDNLSRLKHWFTRCGFDALDGWRVLLGKGQYRPFGIGRPEDPMSMVGKQMLSVS